MHVDFFDKDGMPYRLIHNNEALTLEEILKLNDIPLSSVEVSEAENGAYRTRLLYNTIFKSFKSIPVERVPSKAGDSPIYYTKQFIGFDESGALKRFLFEMDRDGFGDYIQSTFSDYTLKKNLVEKGDSILFGFSGGTDSTTMLNLLKSTQHLPDYDIKAVTVGNLGGTPDKAKISDACAKYGMEHEFIGDNEIITAFNLKYGVTQTIDSLVRSEKREFAVTTLQHMLVRMLEIKREEGGHNKIMMGLERETMINAALAYMLSGEQVAGVSRKTDGENTYIFPLLSLLKKEEQAYIRLAMPTYRDLDVNNATDARRYSLYESGYRGLIMLLAGHLLDVFPGIDVYLENSLEKIVARSRISLEFAVCSNCGGRYISVEDTETSMCAACSTLKETDLI